MTALPSHLLRAHYPQYWNASRQHLWRDPSSGHLLRETPLRTWDLGTGGYYCSASHYTDNSSAPADHAKAEGLSALRAAFDAAAAEGWESRNLSRSHVAAYWGNEHGSWGYYAAWFATVRDYIGVDPAADNYASRGRHTLLTHVRRVAFSVSGYDDLPGCGESRVALLLSASSDPPSSLASIEALPYVAVTSDGGYEIDIHSAAAGYVHLIAYHAGLVPPDAQYWRTDDEGMASYDNALSSWDLASVCAEYETAEEADERKQGSET